MLVNKIGMQHLEIGKNCQDYGFKNEHIKLVCDGCSEGKHTEVGAKSFCHLVSYNTEDMTIFEIFEKLIGLFGQSAKSIKDFLCFTILSVVEKDTEFSVHYCGDGYIILVDNNDEIVFEELDDGEYPEYFAYNYCDQNSLKYYKEGVKISKKNYPKELYKNVGVASDGVRFILNSTDELKNEFFELMKLGNAVKIKRFINRNQKIFKDDTTIVL